MHTAFFQRQAGWAACVAVLALPASVRAQSGDIDFISMFRNLAATQTADGPALVANGSFLSTQVFTLGGNSYTAASLTFPGPPSPLDLPAQSSTVFGYQSALYSTRAEMDAAFPQGSYNYALQPPSGPPVTASFVLGADSYALSQPYLDGSGFSALQGMNAAAPLTLALSPFATNAAAASSYIFFTIYDFDLSQFVVNEALLPPDTGSILLSANTLQAAHSFAYELTYSSRVAVTTAGSNQGSEIGYELRTTGQFFTAAAVPEPAQWLLVLAGLGMTGLAARRSRRSPPQRAQMASMRIRFTPWSPHTRRDAERT